MEEDGVFNVAGTSSLVQKTRTWSCSRFFLPGDWRHVRTIITLIFTLHTSVTFALKRGCRQYLPAQGYMLMWFLSNLTSACEKGLFLIILRVVCPRFDLFPNIQTQLPGLWKWCHYVILRDGDASLFIVKSFDEKYASDNESRAARRAEALELW